MRLIDADVLKFQIACVYGSNPKYLRWLNDAPTVDAVPVRHGHWIVEWETDDTRMLRCSECRMVFNVGKGRDGNWCPECGARMDKNETD